MKVYIELVFIINFLLDFIILYGTKRLLKIRISIIRLIMGSIVGCVSTIILFISVNNISLFIIKIFISIIMILISFGKYNFLKNIFYFYLISIIIGGVIYLFDLNSNLYFNFLLLIVLSPLIIFILIRELNSHKLDINNKYEVRVMVGDKSYYMDGFIDTGNRLKSIGGYGVILTRLSIESSNIFYVPFKTINSQGIITCIKPDHVFINDMEVSKYLIGLSSDKFNYSGFQCILPNKIREDII